MPKQIVWIASYPKSGNTWVRFLVCNLLFGPQDSAAALHRLIPDVHEADGMDCSAGSECLYKTHFMNSSQLPRIEATRAAIYVVRHPADVLASNFFYSQRSQGGVAATEFGAYVESFIEHRGDPRWAELGMGSWVDNVRSWWQAGHFPVLRIRYEDLAGDPLQAGREIALLLRPESSEADIQRAVQNSSFQRMRQIEREDIRRRQVSIFYKPYLQSSIDAGRRFMRRGVVGDGAARLSADQMGRLRDACAPLLAELGY